MKASLDMHVALQSETSKIIAGDICEVLRAYSFEDCFYSAPVVSSCGSSKEVFHDGVITSVMEDREDSCLVRLPKRAEFLCRRDSSLADREF